MSATQAYAPALLARIAALCEADPAREACGFVVERAGRLDVVPITNVADRYHAADPRHFPRTSADGFVMDPREQLRVMQELDGAGGTLVAVWHSHVDAGAHFSAKDRADAVVDGLQQLPGAEYLVAGMRRGVVTELKRFRYADGEFVESDLTAALPRRRP